MNCRIRRSEQVRSRGVLHQRNLGPRLLGPARATRTCLGATHRPTPSALRERLGERGAAETALAVDVAAPTGHRDQASIIWPVRGGGLEATTRALATAGLATHPQRIGTAQYRAPWHRGFGVQQFERWHPLEHGLDGYDHVSAC